MKKKRLYLVIGRGSYLYSHISYNHTVFKELIKLSWYPYAKQDCRFGDREQIIGFKITTIINITTHIIIIIIIIITNIIMITSGG